MTKNLAPSRHRHHLLRTPPPPDPEAFPALDAADERARRPEAGDRPDLFVLPGASVERVREILRARGWRCSACGGDEVAVGQGLYLGFLFLSEETDAYMVGLMCQNPACPHPRDGIRLAGREFGVPTRRS